MKTTQTTVLSGEEYPLKIHEHEDGKVTVEITLDAGYASDGFDLKALVEWLRINRPDLLNA